MRLQMLNIAPTEAGIDPRLVALCGAAPSDVLDVVGATAKVPQIATTPLPFPPHRRPHLE